MIRDLRAALWFCVGVAIAWGCLMPYARAETACVGPLLWGCFVVGGQTDGCAAHCSTLQNGQAHIEWIDLNNTKCLGPTGALQYSGTRGWCPVGTSASVAMDCCTQNLPACVAPLVRQQDGSCGPPKTCPVAGSRMGSSIEVPAGVDPPATACVDGCLYGIGGVGVGLGGSTFWSGKSRGQSCTSPEADKPTSAEQNCLDKNEGFGTVNGVVVCTGQAPENAKSTETTTKPNTTPGGGSTTTTTNNTTCTGDGSCSTTTTTTTTSGGSGANGTGPGSTTTTSEETKKEPQIDFCARNPLHPQCVQTTDECEKHPNRIGCGEAGTLPDVPPTTKDVPFAFNPVAVPVDASCPGDVSLPYGAHFSWAPICDGMGWIKPVVLALAYLAGALIIIGGLRGV